VASWVPTAARGMKPGLAGYTQPVRIMGIDPGFHRCGYAVVEAATDAESLVASGVLLTTRGKALGERLCELAEGFEALLRDWAPDVVAIEEIYFAKNVKTAIDVAQARGVLLEHAAAAGIAVAEYTPTTVKSQLTGNGRADKEQVAYMVRRILRLDDDQPQSRLDDELDAIAVSLCHGQRMAIPEVLR